LIILELRGWNPAVCERDGTLEKLEKGPYFVDPGGCECRMSMDGVVEEEEGFERAHFELGGFYTYAYELTYTVIVNKVANKVL
jgi:hypothetical protein